mgnify:FL=1
MNYRLFLLHGDSKYFDVLERTLYNGLISGVSLDGASSSIPIRCLAMVSITLMPTIRLHASRGLVVPAVPATSAGSFLLCRDMCMP